MMMQLGAEGVFVGSGIFKSGNPAQRAEAIVQATTFHDDPDVIAKVSRGLGEAMVGINVDEIPAAAPPRRARLVVGLGRLHPAFVRSAPVSNRGGAHKFGVAPNVCGLRPQVTVERWRNSSRSNSRPSRTARRCSVARSTSACVR